MLPTDQEYERVLKNPDNIILSEGLEEVLFHEEATEASQAHSVEMSGYLLCEDETHFCEIKKIKRHPSKKMFTFKVFSPSFPVGNLIEGKDFNFHMGEVVFSIEESPGMSFKDDGLLTFTARRIFKNEEIPI